MNRACCVKLIVDKNRPEKSNEAGGSGIILTNRHVITTGSILLPLFSTQKNSVVNLASLLQQDCHNKEPFEHIRCDILTESLSCDARYKEHKTVRSKRSLGIIQSVDAEGVRYTNSHTVSGNICFFWKNKQFYDTMKRTFPMHARWSFDNDEAEKHDKSTSLSTQELQLLLSYFVLIQLDAPLDNIRHPVLKVADTRHTAIGAMLSIQATPFGDLCPSVFMNSVSTGVLSAKAGLDSELLLTDARCIPGSEGGALYVGHIDCEHLLGIIVSPLCWKSSEWVGLAVACSIQSIFNSLCQHVQFNNSVCSNGFEQDSTRTIDIFKAENPVSLTDTIDAKKSTAVAVCEDALQNAFSCVVLVQTSGGWGSGVLIDAEEGYILTCGHVVKQQRTVNVTFHHGLSPLLLKAEVVYSRPEVTVFDVALLKLRQPQALRKTSLQGVNIAQELRQGDRCFVIGHALFETEQQVAASITRGVVSSVQVSRNKAPVLIQSTCAVHNGASGGALVDQNGDLLGIVVCNAKETTSQASYPHINLSVPVSTVLPVIKRYIDIQDPKVLNLLEIKDKSILNSWQLQADGSFHDLKSKL